MEKPRFQILVDSDPEALTNVVNEYYLPEGWAPLGPVSVTVRNDFAHNYVVTLFKREQEPRMEIVLAEGEK